MKKTLIQFLNFKTKDWIISDYLSLSLSIVQAPKNIISITHFVNPQGGG